MITLERRFALADDIERQIIEVIAKKKKLDPSAVTPASTFEQLGLDSLDAADLMFTIEDTFKIVVPDQAALSMHTVGEIIEGVRLLVAQGAQGANAS
jgi:acyl carrier protein